MIDGIFIVPAQLQVKLSWCSLSTNLPGALQHGNIANNAVFNPPHRIFAVPVAQYASTSSTTLQLSSFANEVNQWSVLRLRRGAKHSVFDGLCGCSWPYR